jgi:hypothetical protein
MWTTPKNLEPMRSKFARAAREWLQKYAADRNVTTDEFWSGLCEVYPELTAPDERRKTPRWSCMRDLRSDPTFEICRGKIALRK